MSFWARPIVAAKIAVPAPIQATSVIASGARTKTAAAAGDEVDAGRDHRRGVDEGRDGRRARHRVGEPDVERHLRALAAGAEEEEEADGVDAERRACR